MMSSSIAILKLKSLTSPSLHNVIRPKPGDCAKYVCEKCENPSLKVCALKKHKLLSNAHDLDTILRDARQEDFESEDALDC